MDKNLVTSQAICRFSVVDISKLQYQVTEIINISIKYV